MFGKRRQTGPTTIIAAGVSMQGNLTVNGTVVVYGRVEGDIRVTGRLEIGPGGRCLGHSIQAGELRVAGEVCGDIRVREKVEILPGGRLYGDLQATRLQVHEGGILQGGILHDAMPQGSSLPDGPEAAPPSALPVPAAVPLAATPAALPLAARPAVVSVAPMPTATTLAMTASSLPEPHAPVVSELRAFHGHLEVVRPRRLLHG